MRRFDRLIFLCTAFLASGCVNGLPVNEPVRRTLPASRRVVVVEHDRPWERGSPASRLSPAVSPPATRSVQPATVSTTPRPVEPASPAAPVLPATAPAISSTVPAAVPTPPPIPPVPAVAPTVVVAPATQPIVVQATLTLPDKPLQLATPTRPIPLQLPPLQITLSPDSPPIRVVVENVATTQPATAAQAQPTIAATEAARPQTITPSNRAPAVAPAPAAPAANPAGWGLTLLFLVWVLLAGAAGGALRYLIKNRSAVPEDAATEAEAPSPDLSNAAAAGAIAAFVVPLALGLIASELLARARSHQVDLLPVLALCFFAGFVSNFFVRRFRPPAVAPETSPSDASRDVLKALVESQVDMDSDLADTDARLAEVARSLDEDEAELLRALSKGTDRFRNEQGLATRAELDVETVRDVLGHLEQQGYAARLSAPQSGEQLWYLTRQGRRLAATMYVV